VIAPQGVVGFTMGMIGPRLAGRIGVRRLLVVTAAAAAIGFLVLTHLPATGYSPILFAVTLIGFGTAGTAMGSTVIASRGMADKDQGLVGGMINTSRQIGAAVGAALLPAVALGVHGGIGVSGDRTAMLAASLAAVVATAVAWHAAVHDERMPLFAFEGCEPQISPEAWITPTATLVGDVRVEAEASIWYGAVLRADFGPIIVRRGANVQDGSVLHGGDDPATEVGEGATIGHLCVVHGAVIGAEALIGNGATVLDGARVGERALVAPGLPRLQPARRTGAAPRVGSVSGRTRPGTPG
jgi:MFS family permease